MNNPTNGQDFEDGETGAWARITETHLVALDGKHYRLEELPKEYPLESIHTVRVFGLPGGQTGVAAQIPSLERSPGFTFSDGEVARAFALALQRAVEKTRE